MSSRRLNRPFAWVIAAAVVCGSGGVWRLCRYDSSVPFLPADGQAEWIVYPRPLDTERHSAVPFWAEFRRSFTLGTTPATAVLLVRAFKEGTVRINGQPVRSSSLHAPDWKARRTCEVAEFLKAGENHISVTVSNSLGPPAMWLSLKAGELAVQSDPSWEVSLVGAAWQKAALASEPPPIRPGNKLYGRETMLSSLSRTWPQLLLILLVSAAAVGAASRFLRSRSADFQSALGAQEPAKDAIGHPKPAESRRSSMAPVAVLAAIMVAWVALFANNLPQLAPPFGFDRDGHLEYIDYILQHKALPLADDGWQMYQPPLFYLLSALIISPFGWAASADAAVLTLRAFSALTGIAHLVLVLLCLRRLFPSRPRPQIVGLLVAGVLPMNLCLSHHITNESLAAVFVTAALYFALRLLGTEGRGAWLAAGVGSCLGLAMLTKFSAVLAIPVVLAALVVRLVQSLKSEVQSPGPAILWRRASGQAGLAVAACLAVCGWHYARVWHRFGTPLIGNWDPRLPFAWWQDPGCHTGGWYGRFGQALVCPLFSSISSFADGVYATLWGDGLGSGSAAIGFRPPWNYDLMNDGYLLSLLATALLAAGLVVAVIRFIRQPAPEWFLVLGLVSAFAAGIVLMSLRVASYAQVKAFYAFPALVPICALAALAWEYLAGRSAVLRLVLRVGLLAWAITVYSAFWIRSGNAFTYTVRGIGLAEDGRYSEAADTFSRALQLDGNSLTARVELADALQRLGRREQAYQQAELALQQHPDAAEAHTKAALILSLDQRYEEAVQHLRKALAVAPDHPTACQQLAACLALMKQPKEVIEACRQGLRIDPFNPALHQTLAVASADTGDLTNALMHLRLAVALKPKWPEARSALALILASLGQNEQATEEYRQAVRDKPDDARLHYLYALALGARGDAREAAGEYRRALELQPDMVEALNNLAWILAASAAEGVRNGAEAVRLAEHACDLTQHREPVFLGTLAAAYAEAGRFGDAVKMAGQARELAAAAGLKEVAEKNAQLLELYRAAKPYREP